MRRNLKYAEFKISPINSACQDDTLHFLLEASRRSNTTCLQLYSKDDEAFPGETIASSILSRNLTSQGIESSKLLDTQVCVSSFVLSYEEVLISWFFQNNVRRLCAWRDLMVSELVRIVIALLSIAIQASKRPKTHLEYDKLLKIWMNGLTLESDIDGRGTAKLIYHGLHDRLWSFGFEVNQWATLFGPITYLNGQWRIVTLKFFNLVAVAMWESVVLGSILIHFSSKQIKALHLKFRNVWNGLVIYLIGNQIIVVRYASIGQPRQD
ncbi:hypothetical protein Cgig2_016749 [Carnegiea gigantea]|uniref:Uncharacterized protein n=1 Tax=Carnegiea gigantea TaxID=171969 RepID=A0A9Q1KZ16_9CARY|nr:hypothetical protein Cgig2_016749 [Carnegiea gigantea]